MDTTRSERVGPVAGVIAVLLTFVSLAITMPDMPEFIGEADEITGYYTDDPGKLMGGFLLDVLGTILLLVFVAAVYVRLGGIRRGTLPPAAFAGGVAMCAMFMIYDAIHLALSFRADEDGSPPTEGAVVLNDLAFMTLGLGATMFAAVFVACTGWSALRSGALPRWLAYVSFVLALGLLIPPISWAFLAGLLVWVLVVSVLMWMEPNVSDAAAPPPAATTPA